MLRNKFILLMVLFLPLAVSAQAQSERSTARIERQHHLSHFQGGQMQHSEESILEGLKSDSPRLQQTSIQTLRELMQMAPAFPFSTLIGPLENQLKNEQGDRTVRWLAALALDELHSDAGDAAIRAMGSNSSDPGLKTLCQALMIRSNID